MQNAIDIGSRREVFWDDYLVDTSATTATRLLHHPEYVGTVLTHDAPWEGDGCTYHNIVADEGLYRMYYIAGAKGCVDPSTNPPFPKSKGRRRTAPQLLDLRPRPRLRHNPRRSGP